MEIADIDVKHNNHNRRLMPGINGSAGMLEDEEDEKKLSQESVQHDWSEFVDV